MGPAGWGRRAVSPRQLTGRCRSAAGISRCQAATKLTQRHLPAPPRPNQQGPTAGSLTRARAGATKTKPWPPTINDPRSKPRLPSRITRGIPHLVPRSGGLRRLEERYTRYGRYPRVQTLLVQVYRHRPALQHPSTCMHLQTPAGIGRHPIDSRPDPATSVVDRDHKLCLCSSKSAAATTTTTTTNVLAVLPDGRGLCLKPCPEPNRTDRGGSCRFVAQRAPTPSSQRSRRPG